MSQTAILLLSLIINVNQEFENVLVGGCGLGCPISLHSGCGSFWLWSPVSFFLSVFASLSLSLSPSPHPIPAALGIQYTVSLPRFGGLLMDSKYQGSLLFTRELRAPTRGLYWVKWNPCHLFKPSLRCHLVSPHSTWVPNLPYSRKEEFYSLLQRHDKVIKNHGAWEMTSGPSSCSIICSRQGKPDLTVECKMCMKDCMHIHLFKSNSNIRIEATF